MLPIETSGNGPSTRAAAGHSARKPIGTTGVPPPAAQRGGSLHLGADPAGRRRDADLGRRGDPTGRGVLATDRSVGRPLGGRRVGGGLVGGGLVGSGLVGGGVVGGGVPRGGLVGRQVLTDRPGDVLPGGRRARRLTVGRLVLGRLVE